MSKTSIEQSAGGFVFARKNDRWYVALLVSDKGRVLTPKGLIDQDEEPLKTAMREIREELGFTGELTLVDEVGTSEYWYNFEGEKHHKEVTLYLFETDKMSALAPQKEEGFSEAKWFPIEEAQATITFDQKLLKKAYKIINGT